MVNLFSRCLSNFKRAAMQTSTFCAFINSQRREIPTASTRFIKSHYIRVLDLDYLWFNLWIVILMFLEPGPNCGSAGLHFQALIARFTMFVCFLFQLLWFYFISRIGSHNRSILVLLMTPKAKILWNISPKNVFITATFHSTSLTACYILLVKLSALSRIPITSPQKVRLFARTQRRTRCV